MGKRLALVQSVTSQSWDFPSFYVSKNFGTKQVSESVWIFLKPKSCKFDLYSDFLSRHILHHFPAVFLAIVQPESDMSGESFSSPEKVINFVCFKMLSHCSCHSSFKMRNGGKNIAAKGRHLREKRDYVGKIPKQRTPPSLGNPCYQKKSWVYFSF